MGNKKRNRTTRTTEQTDDEQADTESKSGRPSDALAGVGTATPMIDQEQGTLTSQSADGLTGDGTADVESREAETRRTDEQSRPDRDGEQSPERADRQNSDEGMRQNGERMDDENERTDDDADTSFGSNL